MKNPTRNRFNKILHFLIEKFAERSGRSKDDTKDKVREYLVDEGLIKESIGEANLKGLAVGCNLLERMIKKDGEIHTWRKSIYKSDLEEIQD
jgi:hypothetical protein